MTKLTQRTLEAIQSDQTGTIIRDEGNLFGRVRVKADGKVAVSFYYRYRYEGKAKDISCGTWPTDSLAEIRAARDAARAKLASGLNPAAEKKLERHDRKEETTARLAALELQRIENLTVKDMFDAWLLDGVRRKDGNAELRRSFGADVLPAIGPIAIKDLTEHDLRGVLRVMVARGVNRAAVMVRNSLTQMFTWAEKRQPWRKLLIDGNPMELIEIEKIVAPDYDMSNERDRILADGEIAELQAVFDRLQAEYDAAPDKRYGTQPVAATTQRAIWIMLSTLCRVGEMSMARWEHVNMDAAEWFIPKENVKDNLADLTVYLSPFALDQFRQLQKVTSKTEWCFPARNNGGHVDSKSISKQVGDRQSMFKKAKDGGPRAPMKNRRHDDTLVLGAGKTGAWTPHDLRRTGATLMQRLGVSLDIIDRCQNHVLPGSKVRRHYLHHDYADEKRDAWGRLGAHIALALANLRSGV
ncbi:tyrosine-type recombinase/integrase [Massilia rubra]|uniref:Tyrosine-type recombinase/integrase n=1 Tax=Massilia rubra TaxID=2607910 RepID=A0ABX0M1T0_9BURK|nr:site-specific integrase [Massilia rubra]NHZ38236.1 tyrosine-type recombinase/integrase [Massilia rubra]